MRQKILPFSLGILLLLSGCATTPNGEQRIITAVKTSTFVGTWLAVRDHDEWRPDFKTAYHELSVIEQAEVIDFPTVLAVLLALPIKELKSDEAVLVITVTSIVLKDSFGSLPLEKMEQLRPIVRAMREGIGLGLGVSASEVLRQSRSVK